MLGDIGPDVGALAQRMRRTDDGREAVEKFRREGMTVSVIGYPSRHLARAGRRRAPACR